MHDLTLNRRTLLTTSFAGLAATAAGIGLTGADHVSAAQSSEDGFRTRLFDVTFLQDWQPEGKSQGAFYRITIEPGQQLTYLPGPYCGCSGERIQEGTAAEVVLSGSYAIQLDIPFIARRNGQDDEEIEAGREVTLRAGDVAIYPNAIATGLIQSVGNQPVRLFGASITSLDREEGVFTPEIPEGMSARLSVAVWDAFQEVAEGDVVARMSGQDLAEGESLGPYEMVGLEAINVAVGELASSIIAPGSATPAGEARTIVEGGTVAFSKVTPGTQRFLENTADGQTSLIGLVFSAAEQ